MVARNVKNKPVVMDLFAGCGGLSLGLEQAGFFPVYVNELNKEAMATYLANRERLNPLLTTQYHSFDIKEMVKSESYLADLLGGFKKDYGIDKGEVDLIAGGPPCQGFSGIGHRRSYSVEKKQLPSNHLFQDMAYVINKIRPKIFLFENVQGLLTSKWTANGEKGEIWHDVRNAFETIPGYQVRSRLVYAKDYGVPQNRPRILLVGIRDDLNFTPSYEKVADGFLPRPKQNYPHLADLLDDLIDPKYANGGVTKTYPHEPESFIQEKLRKNPRTGRLRPQGENVTEHEYSKHAERVVKRFEYMLKNNGEIPEALKTKKFSQRLLPKKWGSSGPTITATSLPDDYVHYSQPRTLTVREWARLQMFPDWYEFHGKRTTGGLRRAGNPREGVFDRELPKYTQIGNAVPVGLAEAIGKHFLSILRLPQHA